MTPETQRIAIAEACGWEHRLATGESPVIRHGMALPNYFDRKGIEAWWHQDKEGVWAEPPNYPGSLDACHEMEKQLHANHEQAQRYFLALQDVVFKTKHSGTGIAFQVLNATAPQRCEAFLKTLGLWKDEEGA